MDRKCADVVVVGGGLSGLSACAKLSKSGVNVMLVEAADYLGGRVKQIKVFESWPPVDVGGEIIHGCKTITYRLALENNWDTEMLFDYSSDADAQTEWIFLDGKLYPFSSTHPDILAADTAHSGFMYCNDTTQDHRNAGEIQEQSESGKDVSAAEYFDRHPEFSEKTVRIFKTIYCQTEAATLETYGSCEQGDFETMWPCGEGNYRLLNSQEQLVKYFISECEGAEIRLNWQAKEIDYTNIFEDQTSFRVTVANQNGETLRCKAVVVCVPLTILKDEDIHFKPELPDDKKLAVKNIQMHTGFKITCRFSEKFWPSNCSLVFNCTTDISQIWMYTNFNKETGDQCHIVTGFQTADLAAQKAYLTADDVKTIFINDLDHIFGSKELANPASKYFIDFVYYHWSSNPFVRGAYSSPSVNARGCREILARPVRDLVYFAGEATRSVGDCCTVSGAIESGKQAAQQVMKIFKK